MTTYGKFVWTLLRINPQSQSRYVDYVRDQHPDTELYFPVYQRISRPSKHRRPLKLTLPVYPGYVFAKIQLHDSFKLTSLPVRAYFFRYSHIDPDTGDRIRLISQIPDSVISTLRHLESNNLLVHPNHPVNPYRPGSKVRVHLPVADIEAIVICMIGQTRISLDTPLGRMILPVARLALAQSKE